MMEQEFKYSTTPKVTYYYSLKDTNPTLFVGGHSDYKTQYSTSRQDAKLFKGFGEGDNQPSLETHDIWRHTEVTEYEHKLLDVSELDDEEEEE